jgi:hypothetical protein
MRTIIILCFSAIATFLINIAPAHAAAPLADRQFAEAKPTAITLQCGSGGVPTFVARIDLEAKVINVTFTDGDKDSAVILGERNGILLAKTSEGALLAFKGDQWALSVDGGQSAVAGGTCKQMVRV